MTEQQQMTNLESERVDFAIVTALPLERDAVLEHLDGYEKIQKDNERTYYRGYVTLSKTEKYQLLVVLLLDMGNVDAGITTTQLIERWQPSNIIMMGIAGGNEDKVKLGDVVVAKSCYYYELEKQIPGGVQRRPKYISSNFLRYFRLNFLTMSFIFDMVKHSLI
jgi:nucleoside phosphorylase